MESRVFVKNIPVECTEDILKSHFVRCGIVTDVRIQRTKSGKSRQFGFVGFFDEKSKNEALKLNRSFIGASKIVVCQAYEKNSESLPRPWSRHTKGTSANKRLVKHQEEKKARKKKEKEKKLVKEQKRKEQYDKYLEMNEAVPIWDNDLAIPEEVPKKKKKKAEKKQDQKKRIKEAEEIEDEIELVPTNIVPMESIPTNDSSTSDLDYLLKRTVNEKEEAVKKSVAKAKPREIEYEEGRLFIRNLSYSCTEDDLQKLFGQYGDLSEVYIPVDKQSKRKTGIAFVTFVIPSNATKAKEALAGKFFQGRYVHIMDARSRRNVVSESKFSHIKSSFKRKQMVEKKKSAGSAFNWNTMYIRQDTAVQKISEQLGIRKSDILDIDSNSLPVRVALAETEAIRQTKEELGALGINFEQVDRAEHTKTRSRTLILVKNIPSSDSCQDDLYRMFGKFGKVQRVVVPKIGTMAVVEFGHASEAKIAFDNLAYKKYKNVPLYLEWAPLVDEEVGVMAKPVPVEMESRNRDEDEEDNQKGTLFVKNLSPRVSEGDLMRLFSKCGDVVECKVIRDRRTKTSRGIAIVTFSKINESVNAYKRFQNFSFHGKELMLQYKESEEKSKKSVKGRRFNKKKLIVKNLAFEANKKDLQELFSAFGEIKEIRIPRKVSGGHRGFAFIEFLTNQECVNARTALSNTHLFGRGLVLEHALEDNSVEAIRENMKKDFRKKRKREKVVEKTNVYKRRKMKR